MLTVDLVKSALRRLPPVDHPPGPERSRAGVALILAGPTHELSICFMQRVARTGDRWSGDIALPGGWARVDELRLRDTAIRETREEVGVRLDPDQHLGDLPAVDIVRGRGSDVTTTGIVGPSVFYVGSALPSLEMDPGEVADAFWLRCAHLYTSGNLTSLCRPGAPVARPAVRVDHRVIWGLTYRVLVRFSDLVLGEQSPLIPDSPG